MSRKPHAPNIFNKQNPADEATELRLSVETLRISEQRFRAFVTASSDVVYRMSPDWVEMRQLDGRNFIADTQKPSATWLEEYIFAEDQPRVLATINEAIRTKSIFDMEHRVRRVDGSLGWTHSRAVPLLDANGEIIEWFGAASDVTERKRVEEALASEKAALAAHVAKLEETNAQLATSMHKATTLAREIEKAKVRMTHLAQHDPLTDLPNRILLYDRLHQAVVLSQRQSKKLGVMFLDLDRFKHINDSLGHIIGDRLLQSVATSLAACVRNSDTVCRQGGDEFVILLADIEGPEDAALIAHKILTAINVPQNIEDAELHITVSIGISIYPDHAENADSLIKAADIAMYHAKEQGRNRYLFFQESMNILADERHILEAGLRRALERKELRLHYQPKINLETGTISGVEALVRWVHPQRGVIMPEQFIWVAEDCGLIIPIGAWILQEACQQAQNWQKAGLPPITVAVNISAVQFRHKGFLESVASTLNESHLAPRYLELELTESVLMHDVDATTQVLASLKAMGIKLAIDDFGTGYSSLSYLKRFPIDTLKIDQSFLRDITSSASNSDDAAIVVAVVNMGKSLNQRVIAEGVETCEQLAFLQANGCGEGQGFYFSGPLAAEELAALLRTGLATPTLGSQ